MPSDADPTIREAVLMFTSERGQLPPAAAEGGADAAEL